MKTSKYRLPLGHLPLDIVAVRKDIFSIFSELKQKYGKKYLVEVDLATKISTRTKTLDITPLFVNIHVTRLSRSGNMSKDILHNLIFLVPTLTKIGARTFVKRTLYEVVQSTAEGCCDFKKFRQQKCKTLKKEDRIYTIGSNGYIINDVTIFTVDILSSPSSP